MRSKDAASAFSPSTAELPSDLNSWIAFAVHARPFIDNEPVLGLVVLDDDGDLAIEDGLLAILKRS